MDRKDLAKPLRIFRQSDAGETELPMPADEEAIFVNDITRHRITGAFPAEPNYALVNFVACVLHDVTARGLDFSECDFKDSFVRDSEFIECTFDNGAFATTFFLGCTFRNCTFYNVAVHSGEFTDTVFDSCDLTNLLVKSSKFTGCIFRSCSTTNRIMEMSVLFDTRFEDTDIQVDTISGNFGLRQEEFIGGSIRSGRTREDFRVLDAEEIRDMMSDASLTAIEKIRIQYFLEGDFLAGSVYLDEALDLSRWSRIYNNPGSFVELLESFSDFMVQLYREGRLLAHAVLMLHYVTSILTARISSEERYPRLAQSVAGAHLVVSRLVEEYLEVLTQLSPVESEPKIRFLSDGPLDKQYFEHELALWITPGVSLLEVRERNSPVEVLLGALSASALLPLIAAFLAGRTRFEIVRMREKVATAQPAADPQVSDTAAAGTQALQTSGQQSLFLLAAGPGDSGKQEHQLTVRSLMPGSLVFDLRLTYSTRVFGRIRKILIELLDEDKGATA